MQDAVADSPSAVTQLIFRWLALQLDHNSGETVHPAKFFQHRASCNSSPEKIPPRFCEPALKLICCVSQASGRTCARGWNWIETFKLLMQFIIMILLGVIVDLMSQLIRKAPLTASTVSNASPSSNGYGYVG